MQGVGKWTRCFAMLVLGVLLLLPMQALGAVGQIKGQITDSETGEPVVGASVLVKGTPLGAMTDADGRYTILRVDIGTYELEVRSVDYNTTLIKDVDIQGGLTTEQNVELSKKVTDIGQTIEVIGTRKIIDKFVTENKAIIDAEAIKTKPVQNVDALLEQVAGVQTTSTGEVFIRGGRAGEVAYIVDGVEIGDPLGGFGSAGANLSLVSGSIQEIQIIKDGFDPEYGNALSGIVNISTQTGSKDNTRVNMQYMTDDFGTSDLNKYSRNYDFTRFSISGPDPLFRQKILPAFGLNFMREKEFTYYFYAEMSKDDDYYQMQDFDTRLTRRDWPAFNLLGLDISERARNRYYWMANFKFRPKSNLNFILSYKNSSSKETSLYSPAGSFWAYRYSNATLPIYREDWQTLSLEVSQSLTKNTTYVLNLSWYNQKKNFAPGDPEHPGKTLNPDDFTLEADWETYTDVNGNGVYDAPEPILNLFPDSAQYGNNFTGPAYTYGEYNFEVNNQGATSTPSNFRFNDNGIQDFLEGEPFLDLNGNGVWDSGDILLDKNGNRILDSDRVPNIDNRTPETFIDGDSILGEPFTDVNGNGIYDPGIDIFVRSPNEAVNQDLNYNGQYDGPLSQWDPKIPYIDRNGNGVYDPKNFRYDPGEPFVDRNGNGRYDFGGTSTFYDPLTFSENATWQDQAISRYRGELKVFHQIGNHELKLGGALTFEDFEYKEISRPYLLYTGRPDGGPFPTRGAFRDVFSYQPWRGDFYMRDKLEYGSMIASLGFRWDFFIQDTKQLIDVAINDDLGSGVIYGDRQKFSPRIGFSYPISDKAKVYFNYGHFFQLPQYTLMYRRNTASVDQNLVVGNYNLDFQKTIQYSFGVKYAMTENYSIDISGYFKDEFDKINSKSVRVGGLTRQQYRNSDYGRSRGFEMTLEKRGGGYVSGQLSYTYAFAFGKASQANENYLEDFELSREPLSETPLDNDIRHSFKAAVTFYVPTTVKPRLFGVPIFNGWSLTIESVIESGRPFTPDRSYPGISQTTSESIENNSLRYPSTAVFDARFAKEFTFYGLSCEGILWVENVFDTRNVDYVYPNTGRADTRQNQSGVIKGGTEYDANPYNWNYGRQIRVGIDINI